MPDNRGNSVAEVESPMSKRSYSTPRYTSRPTTHGHARKHGLTSREYRTWSKIKQRCLNPKHNSFRNYGARGIKVCDRWLASFEDFLSDMGLMPAPGYSIERLDNDGDYCPENCRWATKGEQVRNTRRNVTVTVNSVAMCLTDACAAVGVNFSTAKYRLRHGWPSDMGTWAGMANDPAWVAEQERRKERVRAASSIAAKSKHWDTRGEANTNARLTADIVAEIRRAYANKEATQKQLAERFHVNQTTVGLVVRGLTWKHVGLEAA